jgi:catechol 2,3-dioxygenase-like lactoylglutathione lyase family enzyme
MVGSRKLSRSILVLLIGLAINHCNLAQTASSMRPSLIAIQVENLDSSITWYEDYLNFRVIDRKEFKDQGLRLAILQLGDFKLELVDNDKALHKSSLLKQNDANDITGFAKATFTIDNVHSVYETLKKKGATFALTLRDSNMNRDEQFFIVLDCDNNWLQFIGQK